MHTLYQAANVIITSIPMLPIAFMAMVWVKQCFMGDVV